MLNSLLVFDIETIPDIEACFPLTGKSGSTQEQREALRDYHLNITEGKNDFLRQPFHKIIVISLLKANIERVNNYEFYSLQTLRSGDSANFSEQGLIQHFFSYFCREKPRLVSFNGRTFDLPVLKYRAMIYGIQAEALYKSGDKWNNYTQRYSIDWHCDLLDLFSDYGTSAKIKMNEVCSIFKIPGKLGIDGSQVVEMYDKNQLTEIKNYCEWDVLSTYLLYLKASHHQGRISTQNFNNSINDLINYLSNLKHPHLLKFLEEWKQLCKGVFTV